MKLFTELKIAGDAYPGGFATGLTMHGTTILIDQPETRYNALKEPDLTGCELIAEFGSGDCDFSAKAWLYKV